MRGFLGKKGEKKKGGKKPLVLKRGKRKKGSPKKVPQKKWVF